MYRALESGDGNDLLWFSVPSWVHAATAPDGGILLTSLSRMILNQGVCVWGGGRWVEVHAFLTQH